MSQLAIFLVLLDWTHLIFSWQSAQESINSSDELSDPFCNFMKNFK